MRRVTCLVTAIIASSILSTSAAAQTAVPQETSTDSIAAPTQAPPPQDFAGDIGVSLDVQSGVGSYFDAPDASLTPGTSPSPTAEAPSNQGSGAMLESAQIPIEELMRVRATSPYYAPYERRPGGGEADTGFVPFSIVVPAACLEQRTRSECEALFDNRSPRLSTLGFPDRAIVQITFTHAVEEAEYACTGTMISPRVVLTAGHCVNAGGVEGWHRDFSVRPGRNGAVEPFGSCNVVRRLYALQGFMSADPAVQRLYDLGAIELGCDIGDRTGFVPITTADVSNLQGEITVQGYPCDKTPEGRQWISVDQIRATIAEKYFYQNDTWGCMSGAPVMMRGTTSIIAVHTNGLHGEPPWSENNAGTRITPLRLQRLNAWMAAGQ